MGQNKFYTDLDSLLMPVHGAWCMVAAELDVAKKVLYNLAHIYVPTHPGYCTIRTHCCISDLNTSTELLVKTTLFDRVTWHKS